MEALTNGRFQIRSAPAGKLVPAFQVLDAVQQGTAEAAHSALYYFVGNNPAGAESVTVPAGTFQAYRIEMSSGAQNGTLWVRQDAPHVLLKQELAGQPIAIELQAMQ